MLLYDTAATRIPSSETNDPSALTIFAVNFCTRPASLHPAPVPDESTEAEASITKTTSARTSWHGVDVTVVVGEVVCVVVSHM